MAGLLGQLPPGLRGYLAAEQMQQQRGQNELQTMGGLLGLQGQAQQLAIQNQGLQQKQLQQERLNQFASTLPEADRQRFMVNPQAYLTDAYKTTSVKPGESLVRNSDPTRPLFTAPALPAKPSSLSQLITERDALPVGDPRRTAYEGAISKAGSHAPPPNVSVKVDTKLGESFAKEIAPMMGESRSNAIGASGAVQTAGRINAALDSGNVTLGPTATIRNKADQVAQLLGVGGETTEQRLVNTREVIRGLSQFALSARKQLKGQGQVSDYEGRLIQRAEAGEIEDFTMPELRAFVGVTDKLARQVYGEHKRQVGIMQSNPELQRFVPFYDVPELPAAPQQRRRATDNSSGWSIKPVP